MSKRGPKIGDAISLWNFAPSPGFTKEEVCILKLALQYFGVGRWVQILDTGLLPGKLIQQLNGQTQRLLGQQSLAAYTGLRVDIDRIRADNAEKEGERKGGLLINSGPNPNKELRAKWQKEAKEKYGISDEQVQEAKAALDKHKEELAKSKLEGNLGGTVGDLAGLDKAALVGILKKLRVNLKALHRTPGADGLASDEKMHDASLSPSVSKPAAAETVSPRSAEGDEEKENEPAADTLAAEVEAEPVKSQASKKTRRRSGGIKLGAAGNNGNKKGGAKKQRTGASKRRQSAGSGDGNAEPEVLEQLLAMGFERRIALQALEENDNKLQEATEWIMLNAC
mmetsp:Transcript_35203/g.76358  ORF Transcript_35203/g.76358 Transcript_35203/m.76358 type:complete len:339 (-) Transcript_35203:1771-2787(-)